MSTYIKLTNGMDCATGTLSHGTLQPRDVLPELEIWVDFYNHDAACAINEAVFEDIYEEWEAWDNAINEVLPETYYFGAHEGDGADFGIWKIEQEL